MHTLAEYSSEQILPIIGFGMPAIKFIVVTESFTINVCSVRLECFKRNPVCVGCGVIGTIFKLQRHHHNLPKVGVNCFIKDCPWCAIDGYKAVRREQQKTENPHLNMYGRSKSGRLILMTRDHIYPRSRGGSEKIENQQTMCSNCNNRKADIVSEAFGNVLQVG